MKIYYILDDELKHVYSNNTKPCTAISYSNGGNLLAAGKIYLHRKYDFNLKCKASSSILTIYNPYDYTVLHSLNGHSSALKDIEWIDNDLKLISTCQNGLLNLWDMQTGIRIIEHAYK